MASVFNENDDEEDVLAPKEPQVSSYDPGERKAARALRIKRRQEALKRAEQHSEEILKEEEPGPIEQATATAAEELQRLSLDGAAKVTNVKVTTDEREVIRRSIFSDKMKDSMGKIEAEATEAQIQYEAITSNWDAMLLLKDPLDIDAAIKEQNTMCRRLLEQKDDLINALKQDLNRMDDAYYEDLEKQDKDIKELSDRVEKQITIMQRAYEKQLTLIEQAIDFEREIMIDHNNKRWEALYRQRDKEEVAHMEYRFEQLEEHKEEMESIMWDHHAKYRETKIELETLIQELQKELEKLKATCIINAEKIGYNYQVLKKREEENIFVRSQQKRKLNKMSDMANTLRAKIRKAAEDGAAEEIKADAEIVKLMKSMGDLEKKCNHFSHVNNYKFNQVWRMSAERCTELAQCVRQAEVAMHAHILAEPPPPPPPNPPKNPVSKYESKSPPINILKCRVIDPRDKSAWKAKDKLVRHILQLVADNTGFLIEDRLLQLMDKYPLTSRKLCTLDSIFMALEIQAEEDIELLCNVFLNYAFCPICIGGEGVSDMLEASTMAVESQEEPHHVSINDKGVRGDRSSTRMRPSMARSISASTSRTIHVGFRSHDLSPADQLLMAEADEILQRCGDPKVSVSTVESPSEVCATRRTRGVTMSSELIPDPSKKTNPFLCPIGHHLEIEPMQVLTALNEFMTLFVPPDKKDLYDILNNLKTPNFSTPTRQLTTEEIEQYWVQWKNLFSPEKDRFWDGLLSCLNNYLVVLQERERVHDDVVQLRQRNAALRRLIRGALPDLPLQRRTQPRSAFTAPVPDLAPSLFAKLPPI